MPQDDFPRHRCCMQAVADFAREHSLTPVIDNTFATPVLLKPAQLGFIVIHSATKFLNGHSDILAGAVSGPADFIQKACADSYERICCPSLLPQVSWQMWALCSLHLRSSV